jgi:hypothetical protein
MRNNLDSQFDAEWYLSVLQSNVIAIVANERAYTLYNPVGVITVAIVTASLWFWWIVILSLILDAIFGETA